MKNLEKYRDIFVELFHVTPENLNNEFTFRNIDEWNSITHMALISELEDIFGVMFETDEILHFGSYTNGIRLLQGKGVEF